MVETGAAEEAGSARGKPPADRFDRRKVLDHRVDLVRRLRNGDDQVAVVAGRDAQPSECFLQPRIPYGRRSHIDATATRAQVHGHANHVNLRDHVATAL